MSILENHIRVIAQIKKKLNDNYTSTLFNLTISGADLYGFRSEDSDYDYRGSYLVNTNKLLGLSIPKDVIEMKFENKDLDIVLFEVQKMIGLALKGNCNVLEHLNAKQIYSTPEFLVLKNKILTTFGKNGLYKSYRGMGIFNYRKFIASGRKNTVKKYLYVYRALCAGIYVLQTKKIEPNILVLNKHFKIPELKQLVLIKKKGKEDEPLPKRLDTGKIEYKLLSLFDKLDLAYDKCDLPEKVEQDDRDDIESWLIKLRKRNMK